MSSGRATNIIGSELPIHPTSHFITRSLEVDAVDYCLAYICIFIISMKIGVRH